jgi:hypothetical protein
MKKIPRIAKRKLRAVIIEGMRIFMKAKNGEIFFLIFVVPWNYQRNEKIILYSEY